MGVCESERVRVRGVRGREREREREEVRVNGKSEMCNKGSSFSSKTVFFGGNLYLEIN